MNLDSGPSLENAFGLAFQDTYIEASLFTFEAIDDVFSGRGYVCIGAIASKCYTWWKKGWGAKTFRRRSASTTNQCQSSGTEDEPQLIWSISGLEATTLRMYGSRS